jgi:NH3-dependent NAD+ synthetase
MNISPALSKKIAITKKFSSLVKRLTTKVQFSANQVRGFMLGLSGTDSIVTYFLLNEVAAKEGFLVHGVHYVESETKPTPFQRDVLPWLRNAWPKSSVTVAIPPGGNYDQYRWGDIHYRALNSVGRYWIANTTNATEKALGTFGIMANSASISPIISLYKSEILQLCEIWNVPQEAIQRSRLPDCLCGRDEFAAENIDLIDEVLRNNLTKDYPADVLRKAMDYIRDTKRANDFKNRTPYNV